MIELRDRDGFVSDCFYDDLGEGSGASPNPFLKGTGCYFHLPVVSRDLTRGYRKLNKGFVFGCFQFKGHEAMVFLRHYAFFSLSSIFWQNGRKMTVWRAHEQLYTKPSLYNQNPNHLGALAQKHYHENEWTFRLLFAEVDDGSTYQIKSSLNIPIIEID